jgi:AcrR family transcriptional regulator
LVTRASQREPSATLIDLRRKPNPEQRRRDLCDAAIELLGEDGARGISHPKVDQRAAVPSGTTSAYYRTRKALLIGVAERLRDLDIVDLTTISRLAAEAGRPCLSTGDVASMVVMSCQPPWLARTKARHELTALAGRDRDLARTMQDVNSRFIALTRAAITQWQPAGAAADADLVDEQAFVVFNFIRGVMLDFVRDGRTGHSVEHLDQVIQAILSGVRDHYYRRQSAAPA